jgi:hypothetical protein
VNGVVFAPAGGVGDDIVDAIGNAAFDQFDDDANLGDADLDLLLRTANYASANGSLPSSIITTVVLTGLDVGQAYELQLFFMDQRNSPSSPPNSCVGCADRFLTLASGINSVILDADPGNTLSTPFGQFALGTFTADSATQAFDVSGGTLFDPFWGAPVSNRQVNAWQLRAVPEPTTFSLLALGMSLVAVIGRRKMTR